MIDDLVTQPTNAQEYEQRKQQLTKLLAEMKPGITQIIVHPAYDTDELAAITGSHVRRDRDFRVFTDPDVVQLIRDQNVKLITWREIGEGMREMLVTALFQTRRFQLLERDLLATLPASEEFAHFSGALDTEGISRLEFGSATDARWASAGERR